MCVHCDEPNHLSEFCWQPHQSCLRENARYCLVSSKHTHFLSHLDRDCPSGGTKPAQKEFVSPDDLPTLMEQDALPPLDAIAHSEEGHMDVEQTPTSLLDHEQSMGPESTSMRSHSPSSESFMTPEGGSEGPSDALQMYPTRRPNEGLDGHPPVQFNGDKSRALQFINEFELWRRLNKDYRTMRIPGDRVTLALSYIRGRNVNGWVFRQFGELGRKVDGHLPHTPPTHLETDEALWSDFTKEFRRTFLHTAPERAYAALQKLIMIGLDIDEYITQFDTLLSRTTWSHKEKGTLSLFTGGLPAWLIRRVLNKTRPHDLDDWQQSSREEVARELESQVAEARQWRRRSLKKERSSSLIENVRVRRVEVAYARSTKALNAMVTFTTMLHETETRALIDSGATENFISPTLVQSLGLKPRTLRKPIDIHTVDGSGHKDGKLTKFLWLTVQLGEEKTLLLFLVATIGGDHLILGYPFLHRFNPRIDWRRTRLLDGRIQITSSRQTSIA